MLPVPPPTSTLMWIEVTAPSFQPCFSHAARCSLTVTIPQVRAPFRLLLIWVQGPVCPDSQALAPPVPVVWLELKE